MTHGAMWLAFNVHKVGGLSWYQQGVEALDLRDDGGGRVPWHPVLVACRSSASTWPSSEMKIIILHVESSPTDGESN